MRTRAAVHALPARPLRLLGVAAVAVTLATTAPHGAAAPAELSPVTVGNDGNEPLVRVSPDGRTVYVTALQFVYVSRDDGRTFSPFRDLVVNGPATSNADSSIDVTPSGTVHLALNYPFAGTVAACVSTDEARSFSCNPAVVPGVNDRQWVVSDQAGGTYLTSNVGLYHTVLFRSTDGLMFTPAKTVEVEIAPSTGAPVVLPNGGLLQPFIDDGSTGYRAEDNGVELSGPLSVQDWQPAAAGLTPVKRRTPLVAGTGIPSLAATSDGVTYLVSEGVSSSEEPEAGGKARRATGKSVVVGRTPDRGKTWQILPPLPGTGTGTAAMSAIAAGAPGHLGVLYYRNSRGSSAGMAAGSWDVLWAETWNATAARPRWRTTTVESGVHHGPICSHADCLNRGRFAGDFISAHIDGTGRAHLVYMRDVAGSRPEIRYASRLDPTHRR